MTAIDQLTEWFREHKRGAFMAKTGISRFRFYRIMSREDLPTMEEAASIERETGIKVQAWAKSPTKATAPAKDAQ